LINNLGIARLGEGRKAIEIADSTKRP